MNIVSYLQTQQPQLRRQFQSALVSGHLSHAYLLSGETGSPLLEIAKFLAKSLVCEHPSPLADNVCWSCLRIDDGNYADIMIFDGSLATIKKEEIQGMEASFEKTPIEKAGRLIYILHLVENLTIEAVNSLLKFLEEPHQEVYAFLTTENESKVIETIVSRTQKLRVLPVDLNMIVALAIDQGIPLQDAELLAHFYQDPHKMKAILEEDFYISMRDAFTHFLEALASNYSKAHYIAIDEIIERFTQKEHLRLIIDMMLLFFGDILALQNGQEPNLPSYVNILKPLLKRFANLEEALLEITLARGQIDLNVNATLLLDHLFIILLKEYIHDHD